jgi:hypothetical protein
MVPAARRWRGIWRVRRFGFGLGLVLAVVAAACLVAQLLSLAAQGRYVPVSPGSIWYAVHANSLVGFQSLVEQRLWPALWPWLLALLQLPAWLVAGVPAALLLLACRPRPQRGFR